jgi:two-component system chemotaxis sensor kinase CheA
MEAFKAKFKEEAIDLISSLEDLVLKLEKNKTGKTIIEDIFRVMHSLKGGSAMFGFELIDKLTHLLETVYDNIRNEQMSVTGDILNITLEVIDHLRNLLNENESNYKQLEQINNVFINRISRILNDEPEQTTEENQIAEIKEYAIKTDDAQKTYLVTFNPSLNFFHDGSNPLFLIEDLKGLGETFVKCDFSQLPEFDDIEPADCYASWKVVLSTEKEADTIMDIFIFINDKSKVNVQLLSDTNLLTEEKYRKFFAEILSENEKTIIEQLHKFKENKIIKKTEKIETLQQSNIPAGKEQTTATSSIRVSNEKLDNLINWVSELVTIQAQLSIYAQNNNCPGLLPISEEIEKITRRLRDDVFSIRLIPISNMETRFQRLVRELSHELEKEVDFEAKGTETELDKNIIEMLMDPVMHIIRNCMDHGIEDNVKDRIKAGKPAKGKIILDAFYSGANVYIEIIDDGKGIDRDKIRKKAIDNGIISPDTEMSRKELLDLLFYPGFSTASKVTNLSGRGVGLDVVKRKISDLRGSVEIDSTLGKGTTITMKLPLTLSIIDGLLVKIDDIFMVIPLSFVHKVYEFKHETLDKAMNNMVLADDEPTPILNLRRIFRIETPFPDIERVITIDYGDYYIGLTVDEIIGEYQAVLKPLGKASKSKDFFSGASILGDGTVALVLDPNKLIEQYSNTEIKKGIY